MLCVLHVACCTPGKCRWIGFQTRKWVGECVWRSGACRVFDNTLNHQTILRELYHLLVIVMGEPSHGYLHDVTLPHRYCALFPSLASNHGERWS